MALLRVRCTVVRASVRCLQRHLSHTGDVPGGGGAGSRIQHAEEVLSLQSWLRWTRAHVRPGCVKVSGCAGAVDWRGYIPGVFCVRPTLGAVCIWHTRVWGLESRVNLMSHHGSSVVMAASVTRARLSLFPFGDGAGVPFRALCPGDR